MGNLIGGLGRIRHRGRGRLSRWVVVAAALALLGVGAAPSASAAVARPKVASVSPRLGPLRGTNRVTILGGAFSRATAVRFGVTRARFTVVSSSRIVAVVPPRSAGTVDVTVTTAGGTSARVAPDRYTYLAAPRVVSVAPSAGPLAGGTRVVLTGANVAKATLVRFGSTPARFSVASATSIVAIAPARPAGAVAVSVTTPGGTSATGTATVFTYLRAPRVTGLSPNAGPTAGGTRVVISGADLARATAVRFGTLAASFTVTSATSIVTFAPARTTGPVTVSVTTPGGTSAVATANRFTYFTPLTGATAVAVGGTETGDGLFAAHACAVVAGGQVRCWGSNNFAQLGSGVSTNDPGAVPPFVSGLTDVTQLAAGAAHTCALRATGAVRCWGNNSSGQYAEQANPNLLRLSPELIPDAFGVTGATQITAGALHVCALVTSGAVTCWGDNQLGQVGDGTTGLPTLPVSVISLSGVVEIAAGKVHTCARLGPGTVRCWGSNVSGQLGDGTTTSSPAPVSVGGLTGTVGLAAGSVHTCALLADSTVRCWGENGSGELGTGTTGGQSSVPVPVAGLTGVSSLSAGTSHACAVVTGGAVKCWGSNAFGQLGNGSTASSSSPVTVIGITGAVAVSAGDSSTCAVLAGGAVMCWGDGRFGQLGNRGTTSSSTPVAVRSA